MKAVVGTYQPTRILQCETCGTSMPHKLNASRTFYVCSCGTQIEYRVVSKRLDLETPRPAQKGSIK